MSIIEIIQAEVIRSSEGYKVSAPDHYDFWHEHIQYVYAESLSLAQKHHADTEIVALAALLHDIALIRQVGDRKEHHRNGAIMAENMLRAHGCDEATVQRVAACILHHRSCREAENIEERCVADADILAHFDNIPMWFNLAFNRYHLELNQVREWLQNAFEQDFADLSEETQADFRQKYELICKIVLGGTPS